MGALNIPIQGLQANQAKACHVEVCAAGSNGKKGSRLKRNCETKPYARQTDQRKSKLNQSQEDDFLSSYSRLTNGQIVEKFGKVNSTRIATYNSPARKSQQRLSNSRTSKSCLKRSRADQNSIVKDIQSVFKRERRWKKLVGADQKQHTEEKTKINYSRGNYKHVQNISTYLEHAIDEVMKEFQKITIHEVWQREKI